MEHRGEASGPEAPVSPRTPQADSSLEQLRRIERTEQRLWVLALLLFLLVAVSLLLLDITSEPARYFLVGLSRRFVEFLDNAETSFALLLMVLLACAYFYEKLAQLRGENRALVSALEANAQTLAQRNRQLATWAQVSHSLITRFNLPRLLDLIVRTAAEVTESDCAAVMLSESAARGLRVAAIHNRGLQTELARRVAAAVVATGEAVLLRADALPEQFNRPDLPLEPLSALAAAPLVNRGTRVGALLVGRTAPQPPFADRIGEALSSFANQASIALEKANLYAENQRQLDRLGRLLTELRAAEARAGAPTNAAGSRTALRLLCHVLASSLPRILADGRERPGAQPDPGSLAGAAGSLAVALAALLCPFDSRPQRVDPSDLVRRAADVLREQWRMAGVSVREDYGPVPEVTARPLPLQQAFVRLLLACAYAMPSGGELVIRTSATDDGWALVTVEHEATLEPAAAERVFQSPMLPVARGCYVGLPVVRRVIEAHGGGIEVEASPEGRVAFRVRLPAEREALEGDLLAPPPRADKRAPLPR